MTTPFTLRDMTPADSPAVARLTEQSPDGGTISFSPRFHVPAWDVFTSRTGIVTGVVAEAEGTPGLVGAARMTLGTFQFEGELRPYALLSALIVHPDHRRRGIAAALARWRAERAVAHSGADTVLLADIQNGNTGSLANARKWASQITGNIITCPQPMRAKPPRANPNVIVRAATADDLPALAEQINTFYRDYNFHRPQSAASLQAWLDESPLATPVNYYVVAVDRANRLLAGMGIREDGRLMSLKIDKAPLAVRVANLALKLIPPDNEMRNLTVEMAWLAPDAVAAAQYLWQTVRHTWRDRGSSLLCSYDPRSPLAQMLQRRFWMPTTSVTCAIRAPVPMQDARLIAPLI